MKDPAAGLTAEIAVAVFKTAFARWVEHGNERDLTVLMRESLSELKALTAG